MRDSMICSKMERICKYEGGGFFVRTFREKIDNFFYYYKWHTIFGLLAVFLIVTTVIQINSRIDYDTTVTFLGSFAQDEASMKEFQDNMEAVFCDANGDGEVHVLPYFLMISGDAMTAQQDAAAVVRLQGMILARETTVMIMDEGSMAALGQGGALEDLRPFYQEYGLEETESIYGIPIKADHPVFSMFSMTGQQYYITRLIRGEDMNERETADYENAEVLLRMVIEGQK